MSFQGPTVLVSVEAFVKKVYTNLKPKKIDGAVAWLSRCLMMSAYLCSILQSNVLKQLASLTLSLEYLYLFVSFCLHFNSIFYFHLLASGCFRKYVCGPCCGVL